MPDTRQFTNETGDVAHVTRHSANLFTAVWTERIFGGDKKFTFTGTPEEVAARMKAHGYLTPA